MANEVVTAQYNWTDEATDKKMSKEIKVSFDFGEDISDMSSQWQPETVFYHAKANMRISLQGFIRICAGQNLNEEEIQAKADDWNPPTGKPRGMTKIERAKETIANLSEEDKKAFLEELGMG